MRLSQSELRRLPSPSPRRSLVQHQVIARLAPCARVPGPPAVAKWAKRTQKGHGPRKSRGTRSGARLRSVFVSSCPLVNPPPSAAEQPQCLPLPTRPRLTPLRVADVDHFPTTGFETRLPRAGPDGFLFALREPIASFVRSNPMVPTPRICRNPRASFSRRSGISFAIATRSP
jgi:hypothetical protein